MPMAHPNKNTPVVIFAGGQGSRLGELTGDKIPKPLVHIGTEPIITHIIRLWYKAGFRQFIILGGHKFENFFDYKRKWELGFSDSVFHILDTGLGTGTAGRLLKARGLVGERRFAASYGDGLTNHPLGSLADFHDESGGVATMMVTHPISRFGEVEIGDSGQVSDFSEKPIQDKWINAGFFIFEPEIFDFIDSDHQMLETSVFPELIKRWNLYAMRGDAWWHCMDTPKDWKELSDLWEGGEAPWK